MEPDKVAEEALKELGKAAVKEAWEKKNWLLGRLARIAKWFSRSSDASIAEETESRGILIIGPGGTGKTTLARFLAGDVNVVLDPPGFYEPSLLVDSLPLNGSKNIEMVVAPGQDRHRKREFDDLMAALVAGVYRGLILVVDYGHHSIEMESARDHALYKTTKAAFVRDLLEFQREEEIEILSSVLPFIKAATQKLWVLVVVLKQDLWAPQQEIAVKHYRDGEWGKRLAELHSVVESKLIYLDTLFASLHIQNLTTRGGRQILKKNAAGFDAIRQRQSLKALFQALDALLEWEGNV